MNKVTEELLRLVSDFEGTFRGAFNIREDGQCAGRQSSENIKIESKKDAPGLEIHIKPGTVGETVFIPACVTHGDIDDLVYNDFYVGENADVIIVAGCGVHNEDDSEARHNGIHRFFLEKGAHVVYREKHVGTGKGKGLRRIDPVTDCTLAEGALSEFDVALNGEDSGVDLISRSVAKGHSYQEFRSCIHGRNRCTGHSECDAILVDNGRVNALPALEAAHVDAELIHEAAIGKIAGEQLLKLRTLGLTEEEATEKIIAGFLK